MRPHRVGLGVYGGDGPVIRSHRVDVDLDPTVDGGRTPVPGLVGVHAGRLLLLNDGDLTFAKVRFHPRSQRELTRVLADLADPLARALVWSAAARCVWSACHPGCAAATGRVSRARCGGPAP
jgi:aminopeptidase N